MLHHLGQVALPAIVAPHRSAVATEDATEDATHYFRSQPRCLFQTGAKRIRIDLGAVRHQEETLFLRPLPKSDQIRLLRTGGKVFGWRFNRTQTQAHRQVNKVVGADRLAVGAFPPIAGVAGAIGNTKDAEANGQPPIGRLQTHEKCTFLSYSCIENRWLLRLYVGSRHGGKLRATDWQIQPFATVVVCLPKKLNRAVSTIALTCRLQEQV